MPELLQKPYWFAFHPLPPPPPSVNSISRQKSPVKTKSFHVIPLVKASNVFRESKWKHYSWALAPTSLLGKRVNHILRAQTQLAELQDAPGLEEVAALQAVSLAHDPWEAKSFLRDPGEGKTAFFIQMCLKEPGKGYATS